MLWGSGPGTVGMGAVSDNGREDWGSEVPGLGGMGAMARGVGVAVGAGTRDCEDGGCEDKVCGDPGLWGWGL